MKQTSMDKEIVNDAAVMAIDEDTVKEYKIKKLPYAPEKGYHACVPCVRSPIRTHTPHPVASAACGPPAHTPHPVASAPRAAFPHTHTLHRSIVGVKYLLNDVPAYCIGTTQTQKGGEAHTHTFGTVWGRSWGCNTCFYIGMASRFSKVVFRDGEEKNVDFKTADAVLIKHAEFRP
jgi:hypothetical protein